MKKVYVYEKVSLSTNAAKRFARFALELLPSREFDLIKERKESDRYMRIICGRKPSDVTMTKIQSNNLNGRLYTPSTLVNDDHIIMYLHGGAYILGSTASYNTFCSVLSKYTNLKVMSVNYPLAPENPFPAALDCATEFYKLLLHLGYDNKKIIFAGDSAGGGLCIATIKNLIDLKIPTPACAAVFSPWTDLSLPSGSKDTNKDLDIVLTDALLEQGAKFYALDTTAANPLVSPVNIDFSGFPPVHIQVSDEEMLYDDSTRLADSLENYEVNTELHIWKGMQHAFVVLGASIKESRQALQKVREYIYSTLNIE